MTHTERMGDKRRQDAAYQAGFVRLGGCNGAFANRLAEVIAAGAHALQYRR
ncbi:hypothetical protein [Streptomyces sp. NPDC056544]|uniref:hypothetical protein n=1 Tax=unclassified Streptomyces TaxID=2593676 RepID=UPI0036B917B3